MIAGKTTMEIHAILFSKIKIVGQGDSCWLWTGTIGLKGYGRFFLAKKEKVVHRIFYELFKGAIPKDLTIDHLCRVRHCVNPEHLEAVTSKDNVLRGIGLTAICARRIACAKGHPYIDNSFKLTKKRDGTIYRRCRVCANLYHKKYRSNPIYREKEKELSRIRTHEYYKKNRIIISQKRKDRRVLCSTQS